MKILIVEDEAKIGKSLEKGLTEEGYEIKLVNHSSEAIDESTKFYDLALVDIMIPGVSGIEVVKQIKKDNPKTKVIFLTSKSTLEDKLEGFDTGADDYVTKPFSFEELLARIKAVLKRDIIENKLKFKNLYLDLEENIIVIENNKIRLSKKEFDILKFLIINKNKIFSKEEIIQKIWGFDAEILLNTVEVFIKSIRDKIEKPYNITIIQTIRGFGYIVKDRD